jgi:hypothetical protein
MSRGILFARFAPIAGLVLCALLAPIVAHAAALRDRSGEPDWVASLSGLHAWASDVAPSSVYRSFGLVTPLVYVLLLVGLWRSQPLGTSFLRWVLTVAALADALAYGLPSGANTVPGMVEFLCLPLLLIGVGVAAWAQRGNGAWPWLIGACIPLGFVGIAVVQYWPHGVLLGIAAASCLLVWSPHTPRRPPSRDYGYLPGRSRRQTARW